MPVAGQINKAQVSGGGAIDADLVIANRSGDVLIKHTVLKADHFPSCHNTKLTPILEGAPNFRKVESGVTATGSGIAEAQDAHHMLMAVEGIQVYGVAIPTVAGLRQVVNTMMACNGVRKVYWQNLREEPLVFINGNPFVPSLSSSWCVLQGNEAKVVLDAVIDACGAMQNLREGIASYRARFAKEAREKQRNLLLSVCLVGGWGVEG
ncbi:uncharacterized protein HaLaN_27717 [Haematococcus lacustris]|uniref:Uncharacterized protein n=1 Tax=Haematococcus lacustris TaxID=44745 RepID=A0A6A0A975_HAELA|nr:uncharacterized protein HaLaN_27717 [Haematococcus lacustris]